MADLQTLINNAGRDGYFRTIARNAGAQMGTMARRYIGAELLPEREVTENAYREDAIKFRSVIANAGSRYSPVQRKEGDLVASFLVEVGTSTIGREMTARIYDALVAMLATASDMAATAQMLDWADTVLNTALVEFNEMQRWQAIVNASVVRNGDNGYTETVAYANPSGHRFNAGGTWSTDTYDPFDDILAAKDLLEGKGYTVNRIITGTPVRSILARNDKVRAASRGVNSAGNASIQQVNDYLGQNELPPIETYNLQYKTQTSTGFFLARNVMVLCATTGQDAALDVGDSERILGDTLGYTAIGRTAGAAESGRVINLFPKNDYPPRIIGEGAQESLPVVMFPEAIAVIGAIS